MNDGGWKSGKDTENSPSCSRRLSGGDLFGRAIAKIAVAQICDSLGFNGIQHSALDALSDVAIRYISDLGRTSRYCANLAGRTDCNVFDVLLALEELSTSQGFPGASDSHHCLVNSGVVRELSQYVMVTDEAPFARSISQFPVSHQGKSFASFSQKGELTPGNHIPDWLPSFPDPHTYIHTPVWDEKASDPKTVKIEQARQRRKAEKSLLSLQQRLALAGATSLVREGDEVGGKEMQHISVNPFLAPPLRFGEKFVSPIVPVESPSVGEKVSVLETFAPAIEAFDTRVSDNVNGGSLPSKRPSVNFTFGSKKSVTGIFSVQSLSPGNEGLRILKDEEKDEKKRRVEMILKEAMENPHELAQL